MVYLITAAILVHAFVTSRVDYCNLLLARAPKSVTDKLQRVMNAAAWVVSGTKKYDRGLTHLVHSELHWVDVSDRVTYKLGVTVYKCLHGQAPDCLSELCTLVAQVAERQHLRSSSRHLLVVPRIHGFSSIRTAVAPSLSLYQRYGTCSKTICVSRGHANWLFSSYIEDVSFWTVLGTLSALEALFCDDALYKLKFTFTLQLHYMDWAFTKQNL